MQDKKKKKKRRKKKSKDFKTNVLANHFAGFVKGPDITRKTAQVRRENILVGGQIKQPSSKMLTSITGIFGTKPKRKSTKSSKSKRSTGIRRKKKFRRKPGSRTTKKIRARGR